MENHSTTPVQASMCIIIPCYNHADKLKKIMPEIAALNLPCIVVDDASDAVHAKILAELAQNHFFTLLTHENNQGKGGAVLTAISAAYEIGYTHALQIDADGQHNLGDTHKLIALSQHHPDALISAQPIYDETIPKIRLLSRYITHFWVWLETLSFSIKDSMCGFRIYPTAAVIKLANDVKLGKRMDFDIEIMVRLYWMGVKSYFVPSKVIYPDDRVSHFHALYDNLKISWMHTRLVFSMLPKLPKLLGFKKSASPHWSEIKEKKGGLWGIRIMLFCYQKLGYHFFWLLLHPVVIVYWLCSPQLRRFSRLYLKQWRQYALQKGNVYPAKLNSFQHFFHFAHSLLDKIACWKGSITFKDIKLAQNSLSLIHERLNKGTLVIASHLGNIEACRALGQLSHDIKINALVFTKHAADFNQLMKEINPNSTVNLIQVDNIGPDTIMLLKQKIDAGEWVTIVGDRAPIPTKNKKQHVNYIPFLGKNAPFAKGPIILASLLNCPTYLMFCLKPTKALTVYFEPFAEKISLPRHEREQSIQYWQTLYVERLQHYCLHSPLDWNNFYDFWCQTKEEKESS